MPRKSEQEWSIIETDYICNPVTYDILSEKYHLSRQALCARFIKNKIEEKRQKHLKRTGIKILEHQAQAKAKDSYNLIDDIREIIKLKSQAERILLKKAIENRDEKTLEKMLGFALNKSKDGISELAKLEQLLLGNATDRVDFQGADAEQEARRSRMDVLGFNN